MEGKTEDYLGFFSSAVVVNTDNLNKGAVTLTGLLFFGLFQLSGKLGHITGRHFLVEKCCIFVAFATSGLFLWPVDQKVADCWP